MTPLSPNAAAEYAKGLAQLRAGHAADAITALRDILAQDPSHSGAHRNLIRALLADGQHDAVIAETTQALSHTPASGELHYLRGTAFNALSRPAEARDALAISVALKPNFAPAWLNLGNAYMDLDDLTAAEAHCRHALSLDPALIEAQISLGFILTSQGRL